MKNRLHIMLLTVAMLSMTACQRNSYKLEGIAKGFADGDTLILSSDLENLTPDEELIIDEEGKFGTRQQADTTVLCALYAKNDPELRTYFFGEPGTIQLTLNANGRARVSGTKANDAWQRLCDLCSDYERQIEALAARFYDENMTEEELSQTAERIKLLDQEKQRWIEQFEKENQENAMGIFLTNHLSQDGL